jgi:hypothetical protein
MYSFVKKEMIQQPLAKNPQVVAEAVVVAVASRQAH